MKFLRTPDERFVNLPGYDFSPNYMTINGLRVHYVDTGPNAASAILLLHGEPSWSYLYRTMIPVLTQAGFRAIAPDLVGFGRSDKPINAADYSYQFHVDVVAGFIKALDLQEITLVCQDWGGLIGLRVAAEQSDRFARIVAANTALPTGDHVLPKAFMRWQDFARTAPELDVGAIVNRGCSKPLPAEVVAAYDAPFPDERYKMGARIFPTLVPTRPDDPASAPNRAAWKVLEAWQKPFLTAFSDNDPLTHGGDRILQARIPGASHQSHTTIAGAGHFLQEDQGEQLATVVVDFIRST